MKIQVLGSGCTNCKNLYELTKKAVTELGMQAEVEYITDITKMIELGVMTSPVLAIDGKVAMLGATNNIDKIKDILQNSEIDDAKSCCNGKDCDCDCEKNECGCVEENCDCDKSECDCKSGCC